MAGQALVYLVFVLLLDAIATVVLFAIGVFSKSNAGLVYVLFFLYDMSVLALAFLMTPFFDKARVAGIFGAMAVSFLNLFYYIQVATGDDTPASIYWILGLISPTGFALGMDKALYLEINTDTGVQVDSLWDGPGLPIAGSMIMLSVDVVVYILLAYYLDVVLPSEYGARKSPWFCLMPSFWFGTSKRQLDGAVNSGYDGYDGSADNVSWSLIRQYIYIYMRIFSFHIFTLTFAMKLKLFHQPDIESIPESLRGREAVKIRGLSKKFSPFGKPSLLAVNGIVL